MFDMEQCCPMAGANKLSPVERQCWLRARFVRFLHKATQSQMAAKLGMSPQRWRTYEGLGQPMRDPVKDIIAARTPGMDASFLKDGNPKFLTMELANAWASFLAGGGQLPPELDNGS